MEKEGKKGRRKAEKQKSRKEIEKENSSKQGAKEVETISKLLGSILLIQ